MQKQHYTLVFVHDARGRIRKLKLPSYLVSAILVAVLIGAGTLLAGVASYAHLLLRVTGTSQLRAEREQLRQRNRALQATYAQTRERLDTLESLANEVAATYGLLRLRRTPFGTVEAASLEVAPQDEFRDTLARYHYLQRNATAVTLYASGARPLPGQDLTQLSYTPSLWPVRGQVTAGFGDRLDPFNGEGSFHSGVDISAPYGEAVRAAADGFVVWLEPRSGSGRLVVIDHGAGITTWYAHLSRFSAYLGQSVQRGQVIAYVGTSGRTTGPHLHYEVHLYDAPVNPWRFLKSGSLYATALHLRGGD
ncbi:MAG: peptidoglycan DD-metalloendopeptidase family protein [Acidobacteria bacterium]|nr:peptidoglycan DD-metalloendopeptidase family protein [Acidobacteriota bacterium]